MQGKGKKCLRGSLDTLLRIHVSKGEGAQRRMARWMTGDVDLKEFYFVLDEGVFTSS